MAAAKAAIEKAVLTIEVGPVHLSCMLGITKQRGQGILDKLRHPETKSLAYERTVRVSSPKVFSTEQRLKNEIKELHSLRKRTVAEQEVNATCEELVAAAASRREEVVWKQIAATQSTPHIMNPFRPAQRQAGVMKKKAVTKLMDAKDWNDRYAAEQLLWGAESNRFLAEQFRDVRPHGRALDLACGEGRNAIWLAKLGWVVTAVDYSNVAIDRARRLAAEQHVHVEWIEADVERFVPLAGAFQLVIITYLHLHETSRQAVLARAASAVSMGGTLFAVGHARLNLTQGVGGPRQPDLLWEPSEIRGEVAALGLSVQRAEHVLRPVETTDGVKDAIDTLLLARREAL